MAEDQGITIELKENKNANNKDHTYQANTADGGTVTITVTNSNEPRGSNFLKYTHTKNGGQQFTLAKVQGDGSQKIEGIPHSGSDKKVTSVSAYYWKHENNGGLPKKALLVEVAYTGDGTRYYKNDKGNEWVEHNLQDGGLLEKTLYDLNCYRNNAVTLDLTKDAYGTGGGQPCCDGHKGSSRITVASIPVNHKHVGSKTLMAYSYTISSEKLAAIKLADSGKKNRKRITLSGQQFPLSGVDSISALYSNDKKEPILVYLNKGNGDQDSGWYKPATSGGDTWTKAPELQTVLPENINDCKHWNALVGVLRNSGGDNNLQECKEDKPELEKQESLEQRSEELGEGQESARGSQQPGPPSEEGKDGDSGESGNPPTDNQGDGAPAPQPQQATGGSSGGGSTLPTSDHTEAQPTSQTVTAETTVPSGESASQSTSEGTPNTNAEVTTADIPPV